MRTQTSSTNPGRNSFFVLASLGLVLNLATSGCSDSAAMPGKAIPTKTFPVVLESSADLGFVVGESGVRDRIVKLRNGSENVVQVSRWTTSCECLSIEPGSLTLAPQESMFVRLRYDTDKEPGFVGSLLVSVEAHGDTERVGEWSVPVSVISRESLAHLDVPPDAPESNTAEASK